MPDRIIRDGLLDSDRYIDLPTDTHRLLFDHMLISADDLGNTEATHGFVRRRLLQRPPPQPQLEPAEIESMLAELARVDLIRRYDVGGKGYAHIPRYRQRLRSYKRVNPRPPENIECNEIKDKLRHLPDMCPSNDRHMSDTRPSLAVEEKRSEGREEKRRERTRASRKAVDNLAQRMTAQPPGNIPGRPTSDQPEPPLPKLKLPPDWWRSDAATDHVGRLLGIPPGKTELYPSYRDRLFAAIKQRDSNA